MTLPVYQAGSSVTVTIETRTDEAPSSIEAVLTDETGAVLATYSIDPADVSDAGEVDIAIDASDAVLVSATRGLRTLTTALAYPSGGTDTDTQTYMVKAAQVLVPFVNSFMTYGEAQLTRYDLPALNGWDASDDDSRFAAMQLAYSSLCTLRYRYKAGTESQSRIADFVGVTTDGYGAIYASVIDIGTFGAGDWAFYPNDFKTALKRAQLQQADTLLLGDPVADKRRKGITVETIGESSMSLRAIPDVDLAIGRAALAHLRGYLMSGTRIARG